MGIDLATRDGVMRFCELRRNEMMDCFETLGRFVASNGTAYMAYVFARHAINQGKRGTDPTDWKTGPELPEIQAVPVVLPKGITELVPDNQLTRLMGLTLKGFNQLTRATGCIIMGEAWFLRDYGKESQKALEDGTYRYGWVEKHPKRGEALMMMLQHATFGSHQWVAEIHREPTRIDPWHAIEDVQYDKGRLTGLNDWRQ